MKTKKVILNRKKSSEKKEQYWSMFSTWLLRIACSDYISLRLLYFLEPYTTNPTILPKILEVAEKSFKFYLTVNKQSSTPVTDARKWGHNIEKLRFESSQFNDDFNDPDIISFTKNLNDNKGEFYQYFRYGTHETTEGYNANLFHLINVIDKIFFKSILSIPERHKQFFNFLTPMKTLVTKSRFDQTQNFDLLMSALSVHNEYLADYISYCHKIDEEHEKLMTLFNESK